MGKYSKLLVVGIIFAYIAILLKVLYTVFSGDIPFWFDPARDLLYARQYGFHTLIGQNSGIPGIFYGPYWIWMLRFGLFFSKDPRIIDFILQTLPYMVLLPILFYLLKDLIPLRISSMLWILFMLGTGSAYATQLWNPHPAPLLLMLLIFVLINLRVEKPKDLVFIYIVGLVAGFIFSFHISLGIPIILGTFIYLISALRYKSTIIMTPVLYGVGVLTTLLPQILFDFRHDFSQSKAFLHAITTYGGVVQLKGLSKVEIIGGLVNSFSMLVHLPTIFAIIISIAMVGGLFYFLKKSLFTSQEKKLLFVIIIFLISILFIYLTAKNPVWDYHFIATEILWLFLLGLLAKKNVLVERILIVGTALIFGFSVHQFINNFFLVQRHTNYRASLQIVDTIAQDASGQDYTVFVSNPAVYTYEYTYLFSWRYNEDLPYDPNTIQDVAPTVYLVIPKTDQKSIEGYVQYRTPEILYKTLKKWTQNDGTTIIKREKK